MDSNLQVIEMANKIASLLYREAGGTAVGLRLASSMDFDSRHRVKNITLEIEGAPRTPSPELFEEINEELGHVLPLIPEASRPQGLQITISAIGEVDMVPKYNYNR